MVGLCGPPKPLVKRLNPLDPQGLANFLDGFPYAISGPLGLRLQTAGFAFPNRWVCVLNMLGSVRTEIVDCDVASAQHQNHF